MSEKILLTLEEQIDPGHTGLVVVDPQNDFCATDGAVVRLMGWDASRIQGAVERLNRFIQKARERRLLIAWTRSFVDPARAKPSYKARAFINNAKAKGIDLVKKGLDGSDWYSGITRPLSGEYVITKYHYDAFSDTDLDLLLRSSGIKTLIFTGFMTNVCVETSARHAYLNGYYVVVVSDCVEAGTEKEQEATLFNIKTYFGKIATSDEIVNIWEKKR